MLMLMKKDLLYYFVYFGYFTGLNVWVIIEGSSPIGIVSTLGFFLTFTIAGGAWGVELYEEKNKGYKLLSTLPITVRQLVAGKYLMILVFECLSLVFAYALLRALPANPAFFAVSWAFIIVIANLSMILTAIFYFAIFRFGFGQFSQGMSFLALMALALLPIILKAIFGGGGGFDMAALVALCTPLNLVLLSSGGLVIYFLLMKVTARTVHSIGQIAERG